MEKAENIKKLDTYEPQALRKAEITRILNSVKNASFNPKENSLIDISDLKKNELEVIEKIKYDSDANVDIEYWSPDKIILNTKSIKFPRKLKVKKQKAALE